VVISFARTLKVVVSAPWSRGVEKPIGGVGFERRAPTVIVPETSDLVAGWYMIDAIKGCHKVRLARERRARRPRRRPDLVRLKALVSSAFGQIKALGDVCSTKAIAGERFGLTGNRAVPLEWATKSSLRLRPKA
jgi:hypothetical protein